MTSVGAPFGATMPFQMTASKPGTELLRRSGRRECRRRALLVTARARSFLADLLDYRLNWAEYDLHAAGEHVGT